MPQFEFVNNLYWLIVIPIMILIFGIARYRRKIKLNKYANYQNLKQLLQNNSNTKVYFKLGLLLAAIALLVVSYANPIVGSKLKDAKREGIDIVIGLDISYSMLAEDIKPNRLERAKQAISRLLDKLESDRVGLIIFAGRANVLFPLTNDYAAAKMFLSTIDPEFISEQGTALAQAMDIAVDKFKTDEKHKKALLIISDGEDHEQNAVEAAEKAKQSGFVVYTIGMGSPEGAPIPIYRNQVVDSYMKDDNGKTVISKLNADALRNIAVAGGGQFVRTYQTEPDLAQFLKEIDKLDKQQFESKKYSEFESKYQLFLALALILLVFDAILTKYKGRIMQLLGL